jgi:hypothetical protein
VCTEEQGFISHHVTSTYLEGKRRHSTRPDPPRAPTHRTNMEPDLQLRPTSPSVLSYARSHGLCSAYDREPFQRVPRDALDLAFPLTLGCEPCSPDASDAELAAAAAAFEREKIRVSAEAAALLRGIVQARGERTPGGAVPDAWERVRGLKVEMLVLRTDAELDLLRFGQRVEPGVLSRLGVPAGMVNVQDDEGFEWPARYAEFTALWDERVRGEKLRVSGEAMRWLEEMRRGLLSDEEWERCRDDVWRDAAKPVGCEWTFENLTEECRFLLQRGV